MHRSFIKTGPNVNHNDHFFSPEHYLLGRIIVSPNQGTVMRHWRGHKTSPTVASLKGRLPEIMKSTSTHSCDIIQIHSLFRHGFIKKPKSKFNGNRKCNLF